MILTQHTCKFKGENLYGDRTILKLQVVIIQPELIENGTSVKGIPANGNWFLWHVHLWFDLHFGGFSWVGGGRIWVWVFVGFFFVIGFLQEVPGFEGPPPSPDLTRLDLILPGSALDVVGRGISLNNNGALLLQGVEESNMVNWHVAEILQEQNNNNNQWCDDTIYESRNVEKWFGGKRSGIWIMLRQRLNALLYRKLKGFKSDVLI